MPLAPDRNAVQLSFHAKRGEIFMADADQSHEGKGGVYKIKPDGSGYTGVIDSGIGAFGIRGVAVDWVAGGLTTTTVVPRN